MIDWLYIVVKIFLMLFNVMWSNEMIELLCALFIMRWLFFIMFIMVNNVLFFLGSVGICRWLMFGCGKISLGMFLMSRMWLFLGINKFSLLSKVVCLEFYCFEIIILVLLWIWFIRYLIIFLFKMLFLSKFFMVIGIVFGLLKLVMGLFSDKGGNMIW